jgi:hypothetical protein
MPGICLLVKEINWRTEQKTNRRIAQPDNKAPVFVWECDPPRRAGTFLRELARGLEARGQPGMLHIYNFQASWTVRSLD